MTNDNEQDVIFDGDDDQNQFDYSNEVNSLSDGSDDGQDRALINLTEGKTTLEFAGEPNREEWNYGSDEDPDITEKMVFPVNVVSGSVRVGDETKSAEDFEDDEELYYAVTRGSTEESQWGQIARVGEAREGLADEEVTIFRNGTGKNTNYLVEDAAELNDES